MEHDGTCMLQNSCLISNQKSSPSLLDHLELSYFSFTPAIEGTPQVVVSDSRVIRLWPAAGQDRTFKVAPPVEQTICPCSFVQNDPVLQLASNSASSKTTYYSKSNQKKHEISIANINRTNKKSDKITHGILSPKARHRQLATAAS